MKTFLVITLVVVAALVTGIVLVGKSRSHPPVTVTLRIAVSPPESSAFVTGEVNSARFKYLMGKQSGVKPVLAQKLSVIPLPGLSLLEARVGVQTREEGRRCEVFLDTLQGLCGNRAQLTLAEHSVR